MSWIYTSVAFFVAVFLQDTMAAGDCFLPGYYVSVSGFCTACIAGTYCPGDNNRYECAKGYASGVTTTPCFPCPKDTYTLNYRGNAQCTAVPGGQYTTLPEANTAVNLFTCPPGNYCPGTGYYISFSPGYSSENTPSNPDGTTTGAREQAPCDMGTYSPGAQSYCDLCPEGTASNETGRTTNNTCDACSAGTYAAQGAPYCTGCPAGTSSSSEQAALADCQECSRDTYSQEVGATACIAVDPGYYTELATGNLNQTQCIAGYYCDGKGLLTPCPGGDWSVPRSTSCDLECSPGYECPGDSSMVRCTTGTYSFVSSDSCSNCPSGDWSVSGSSHCNITCAAGYACAEGAQTECSANKYAPPGSGACLSCGPGTYSGPGASECHTAAPTMMPTETPTRSPTAVPTTRPTTALPTKAPTEQPIYLPTFIPTEQPTAAPSKTPTYIPSRTPTQVPTMPPTYSPTLYPSSFYPTADGTGDKLSGSKSFAITAQSYYDNWSIEPREPAALKILFSVQYMDIPDGEVTIQDGNEVIFSCSSCGANIPPPFYSNSGSVRVIVNGDQTGSSFSPGKLVINYIAVPLTAPAESFSLSITSHYGHLQPIRVGNTTLMAGTTQEWRINTPTKSPITISIDTTTFDSDSPAATLKIYDDLTETTSSHLLYQGDYSAVCLGDECTPPNQWFTAQSGVARIVLDAGPSNSATHFQLTYFIDSEQFNCGHHSSYSPDVLVGPSMLLTDGSGPASKMRSSDQSCAWRIQPDTGDSVSLVFGEVAMRAGSALTVYDGKDSSGSVLWACVGPSYIIPPVLRSSSDALYVIFTAMSYTGKASEKGFYAQYYAGDAQKGEYTLEDEGGTEFGAAVTVLQMSSSLDLQPPATASAATFTWLVQPSATIGPLTFSISSLNLITTGDKLEVYDGTPSTVAGLNTAEAPLVRRFTGPFLASDQDTAPVVWIQTTGKQATVVFTSSGAVAPGTSTGRRALAAGSNFFQMFYYANGPNYHCGFTRNPALLTAASMVIADGSTSTDAMYTAQDCQWTIQPTVSSSNSIKAISIFFTKFDLVAGASLLFFDGPVAGGKLIHSVSSGNSIPAPLSFPHESVGIQFVTSSAAQGTGFSLTYYTVSDSTSAPGDGVIRMLASRVASLANATVAGGTRSLSIQPNNAMTWLLSPSDAAGPLYFALSHVDLPTTACLELYDGSNLSAPVTSLLFQTCGGQHVDLNGLVWPYRWYASAGKDAVVKLVSSAAGVTTGSFDLSYFSNGGSLMCGLISSPTTLQPPSMVITDGSDSGDSFPTGADCSWLIQPSLPSSTGHTIVLEFRRCDTRGGGRVQVFDGHDTNGRLLWECTGCAHVPRPIVAREAAVFVRFTSSSSESPIGKGFELVYWTMNSTAWNATEEVLVLELPTGYAGVDRDILTSDAVTATFDLGDASTFVTELRLTAGYTSSDLSEGQVESGIKDLVVDGRSYASAPTASTFQSLTDTPLTCGLLGLPTQVAGGEGLAGVEFTDRTYTRYGLSQLAGRYLKSTSTEKTMRQLGESTSANSAGPLDLYKVCKYYLHSQSTQSLKITVNDFQHNVPSKLNTRLRIFGGIHSNGTLLFDSFDDSYSSVITGVNLVAPCGQALVIVETNNGNLESNEFQLRLNYLADLDDGDGAVCAAYKESMTPRDTSAPVWIVMVTAIAILVGILGACLASWATYLNFFLPRKDDLGYYLFAEWPILGGASFSLSTALHYRSVEASEHPRYTPRLDKLRNQFLLKAPCCICNEHIQVFDLKCGHKICMEDIDGYVKSALGDISMFPIKCPMHYQGCKETIDATIAKRILNKFNYERFLEFSDRSTYGDGMRCIFCYNFVNFPEDMSRVARVECPYCIENFCVRCKKPWHYGVRCALDTQDDSLEQWRETSGACKCPSCKKLIEKNDAGTECNHMTHRLSDGMPCIKERTDFCYCCGFEVTGDAPHYEMKNPDIDHFPDGVFEKCRVIKKREREAEKRRREQEKKQAARQNQQDRVRASNANNAGNESKASASAANTNTNAAPNDNGVSLLAMANAMTYGGSSRVHAGANSDQELEMTDIYETDSENGRRTNRINRSSPERGSNRNRSVRQELQVTDFYDSDSARNSRRSTRSSRSNRERGSNRNRGSNRHTPTDGWDVHFQSMV